MSECPRIVSDELFQAVQERLDASQKKRRHRNNHTYLLSGVLHCGECNERMTGTSATSKTGKRYYYYHCSNKHYGRIDADKLESTVLHTIDEYLQSDKIKSVAKVAYSEYCKQMQDDSEQKAVQLELKRIDTQLNNAINAVLSGINSETLKIPFLN